MKMKILRSVIVTVSLLAMLFALPLSTHAETVWHSVSAKGSPYLMVLYNDNKTMTMIEGTTNGLTDTFPIPAGGNVGRLYKTDFTAYTEDTVIFRGGRFIVKYDGQSVARFRWNFQTGSDILFRSSVYCSEWIVPTGGSGVYEFVWDDISFTVPDTKHITFFELEMIVYDAGSLKLENANYTYQFSYTTPPSSEIPKYPAPDGGAVGELDDKEQQLEDATTEGIDQANGIFDNFANNLLSFTGGILAATAIFETFFAIPQLGSLVTISLAIGFVSFVFGLVNMIASSQSKAGQRKDNQNYKKGGRGG